MTSTTLTRSVALSATAVDSGYGHVPVLHSVSVEVGTGEIVALLGPNGAGKSTLLLTLAGYLTPTTGRIEMLGEECKDVAQKRARRGLGFLGEDRHVFPTLTVAQNLKLVGSGASIALDRFPELRQLLRRRAGLLSGGEQQMLGLGRALAMKPKVLLVDELSLGLAPLVRTRLLDMLRSVANDGTGVFVVEQSAKAVLEIADRAYVIRRGEIVDHRPASGWEGKFDELGNLFLS